MARASFTKILHFHSLQHIVCVGAFRRTVDVMEGPAGPRLPREIIDMILKYAIQDAIDRDIHEEIRNIVSESRSTLKASRSTLGLLFLDISSKA